MKKIVSLFIVALIAASCLAMTCAASSRQVIKIDYTLDRTDDPNRTEFLDAFQLNIHDNSGYRWQAGDKLMYDVKISDNIAGLGIVTAHFNPRGNMLSDVHEPKAIHLTDAVNKWHTASFEIPESLGVEGVNYFVIFVAVTADENTPNQFSAYFDNIRIERADGTVALSIFDSAKKEDVDKISEISTGGVWGERKWIKTSASAYTETTPDPVNPDSPSTADAFAGAAVLLVAVSAGALVILKKRR